MISKLAFWESPDSIIFVNRLIRGFDFLVNYPFYNFFIYCLFGVLILSSQFNLFGMPIWVLIFLIANFGFFLWNDLFQDVFRMCGGYLLHRMPLLKIGFIIYQQLPSWFFILWWWLSNYNQDTANLASIFMLINRITAIGAPIQHRKVRKYQKWG